jgi:replicative DNA helicase
MEQDDHTAAFPLTKIELNLEDLLDKTYTGTGLRWRLDCLNKSLGSLRQGDFGFVFARPESGKTTLLASEVTHFAMQAPRPTVWFNNEEQGEKVGIRLLQAHFGVTLEALKASASKYRKLYQEQVGDKLFLFDSALIGKKDVEEIVRRVNPSFVVYDQIDKIRGFANDRDDLRLGSIYQWARELAKGNHAAVGVCQADGHAENVRYLTMEHVANAKTAKQAEADFILGIGKIHDQNSEYSRFLNISKNKLFGDSDSIPKLRHGRFEVLIEPEIARYKDVIKFE